MKHLVVTEEIWKEGNMYTAYCPELDVISCGRDIDEARKNLLEVIEIQLEETVKLGTLETFLSDVSKGSSHGRDFYKKKSVSTNRQTQRGEMCIEIR